MSEPSGPFGPIDRMMKRMLRDSGVYRLDNAYRRSIGLEERLDEAERGLLKLPSGVQRDRVSSELVAIRTELRGLREDGAKESGKSFWRHVWSIGVGVGGIVVGIGVTVVDKLFF